MPPSSQSRPRAAIAARHAVRRLGLVLEIAVAIAPALAAQAPPARYATGDWIVDQWSSDQGLSQNTILAIAQDSTGYLWLATYGGLVRFDGVRLSVLTSRNHPGLGSDRLIALQIARDGTMWIGTDRGLVRFRDGSFREWTEADGRPAGATTALAADDSGGVWVSTAVGGLSYFHKGSFEHFDDAGLPAGWTGEVLPDGHGNVWVHTGHGVVYERPAGDRRFRLRVLRAAGDVAEAPIVVGRNGDPWFASRAGPVRWTGSQLVPLPAPFDRGVSDGAGGFWGVARGLWHVDATGVVTAVHLPPQLAVDAVRSMFVDANGTLWIGTNTSGLLRLRHRVFRMFTRADGLADEQVTALTRDSSGHLWVGSSCGPTTVLRRTAPPLALRDPGCVFAFAQAADGVMWAGIANGGVSLVHADGRISKLPMDSLPDRSVLALYADPDTSMWVGTQHGLLHITAAGAYERFSTASGLPSDEIHYITRDRAGTLWIGTVGGLARLDGHRFRSWTTRDGLPHNYVRAVYQSANGHWWIGTYGGGLARFDGRRFVPITARDGLYENVISAIREDSSGYFWMSGNRGVSRVSRASLEAFADGRATSVSAVGYGPSDGLLTPETNGGFEPSSWQDADGRLWFATVRGLATVDPRDAAEASGPPRAVIEELTVDGATTRFGPRAGGRSVARGLRLRTGVRDIEIRYTGLRSVAPEQILFRYRLHGLESAWHYVNQRRVAYFSGLPPGRYTFEVAAANRDGAWSVADQGLAFTIPSPWWATTWFRALAVITAFATLWLIAWLRLKRVREEQRIEREFGRQLLAGQESERRRLAGELHDSLGQDLLVMKNRAALALRASGLAPEFRAHVEEIADVATQAVQNVREISHGLRPYQLDRLGLAAALRDLADRAATAGVLDVVADVDAADELIAADHAIHIYRIVQEALNNVLKHAHASHVLIAVRREATGTLVRVHDDGRGTDIAAADGFGLGGIGQRAQLLGARVSMRSAPGTGFTLDVLVPDPRS